MFFFGSLFDKNARRVKYANSVADQVIEIGKSLVSLDDVELAGKTGELRQKLAQGQSLDDVMPEAFAVVCEAAYRKLGMRPYREQIIGAVVLHKGQIAEMKTGEGKTLTATMPVYLNALEQKGVHVVTVNDYLTKRDSAWMSSIYEFLGMSVGCLVGGMTDEGRRAAYACDIMYATNNELAFAYLRDTTVFSLKDLVATRPFNYAMIDEADSLLIDEARTPIILSGPSDEGDRYYKSLNKMVGSLSSEHYDIDEGSKNASFSDSGINKLEKELRALGFLGESSELYGMENMTLVHCLNQLLKAHLLFKRDKDYIVRGGNVVIIDEFTGRMMEDRRYSDGLHQAIEAKEGLRIKKENKTIASITFQNYFKMYGKVSGMTGTAMTEAEELRDIYGLVVVSVPTHRPVKRIDHNDSVYSTQQEKYEAMLEIIREAHKKKQPLLIGVSSIDNSEKLSKILRKNNLPHNVLNAKFHEKEAYIIAQAGCPGAITIATNMAGRGTDIKLGGNAEMAFEEYLQKHPLDVDSPEYLQAKEKIERQVQQSKEEVLAAGGLYVIGSERNDSRRVDDQLRGRSGRQGDVGESKFFVSLEDDLMRMFGGDRIASTLARLGLKDGNSIDHPMINRAIAHAQAKVERNHYDIRKNVNKFDNVVDEQRRMIVEQRMEIMRAGDDILESFEAMREQVNEHLLSLAAPSKDDAYEGYDLDSIIKNVHRVYDVDMSKEELQSVATNHDALLRLVHDATNDTFQSRVKYLKGSAVEVQRQIWLFTLTSMWCDHLTVLSHLQQGIYLRAMGNKDPVSEYAKESFAFFSDMLYQIDEVCVYRFAHMPVHNSRPLRMEMSTAKGRATLV